MEKNKEPVLLWAFLFRQADYPSYSMILFWLFLSTIRSSVDKSAFSLLVVAAVTSSYKAVKKQLIEST